jgi:hypothetical protein
MATRIMGHITPNNTTLALDRDTHIVTLHRTQIVKVTGKRVTLDSGGYQTVTTKRRMNESARAFGLPYRVRQKDFAWRVEVYDQDGEVVRTLSFVDGMTFEAVA